MIEDLAAELASKLRVIPDFPVPGVSFKDITTLLSDVDAFRKAVQGLKQMCAKLDFEVIVAPESRGFIIGSVLAYEMGKSFVPVRKKGKLPYDTICGEYQLEYGTDTLEMHSDAVGAGQKVLVLDDLLATGGTVLASIDMVERLGGVLSGTAFLIELTYMPGRSNLSERGYEVLSLIKLAD